RQWDAYAKVKQIKNDFPELTEDIVIDERTGSDNTVYTGIRKIERESSEITSTSSTEIYFLDKIIESIYSEPDINNLLIKFIDAAIQAIGANRGYLILEKNGELYIETGKDDSTGKIITDSIPIEEYPDISKTVVRYVARTLET